MKYQLEKRIIELALSIDCICKSLKYSYLNQHLRTQIIRSSTSAALNYAEAQSAESKKDFIHKVSLVVKELRETKVCLKLLINGIQEKDLIKYRFCQSETDQMLGIFYKTIQTTKQNQLRNK